MSGPWWVLGGVLTALVTAQLSGRTAFIEQPDYSVEGASTEQVFEVNEWAREWFRYLRSYGVEVPQGIPPIRIVLRTDEADKAPSPPPGTVEISGASGLQRDAVIDGIVSASLIRYSRWRGLGAIPAPWVVTGLTEHFLVYWNPARRDALAREVLLPGSHWSLQALLQTQPESLAERGSAYALLAATGWPSGRAPLLENLLVDATAPFEAFFVDDSADPATGDIWLTTLLAEFRLSGGSPIWNLDTSAWRLEWLAAAPAEWRGRKYLRHLMLVQSERGYPERRAWVEERLRLTKVAITRMHPVYHNATHSLGFVWESILRGDSRAVVAEHVRAFEADLATAHSLRRALGQVAHGNAP